MRSMFARVLAYCRRRRDDEDFQRELHAHLDMLVEDNLRRGMSADEALRAARVRVGNAAALGEQHRAIRGLPALDTLLQDFRFAFRLIARARGFSVAAIIALALGIGANTVGFTIVYGALLRALPFDAADDLYVLSWNHQSGRRSNASLTELLEWRAATRSFAGIAGYSSAVMNISDDRDLPVRTTGARLTANAFGVLKQPLLLGRDFTADDEQPGADPVVILGARLWRSRYGADTGVLGRTLRVNGRPATIIGVMPDGVAFPESAELWVPFVPQEGQHARNARVLRIFARIGEDTAFVAAKAELDTLATALIAAYPAEMKDLTGLRIETFHTAFIGGAGRPTFFTVMGAVCLVLLIACANVANLLLSRGSERAHEVAIRAAVGASRWRIVRQLLIESLVLGSIGSVIGMIMAAWALPLLASQMAESLPYWVRFDLDATVVAYVAGVCVLTAILCGLAPALHISRPYQHDALQNGVRGNTASRRARRFSGGMVVAQLSLTMVLLVGAGLMARSFAVLYSIDLGIRLEGLMTMEVPLPAAKYPTPEARLAFFNRLAPRLTAIPGVQAAALTTGVPPHDGGERLLQIEGHAADEVPVHIGTVTVTPQFFAVVGVPMLRGRGFAEADGAPGQETVIVNERLAHQFFPGEEALGRRIRFTVRNPPPNRPAEVWRTIVGICPTIKQGSSIDRYVNAVAYLPFRQEAPATASLLLKTSLPPASIISAVGREVQAMDADQPVHSLQTLTQVLAADRWWQRTWGSVFGAVAVIALALSSIGLYAVTSYSVVQRTREIGVRLAVGARRGQVMWLVLRRGLVQVASGVILGGLGSLALANVMPGGLEGIAASDPLALASVAALLALVCLFACIIPARRATRVDPVVALRAE